MKQLKLSTAPLAGLLTLVLAQPAMAMDAGKLTKEKASLVHSSKPVYSPYAIPLVGSIGVDVRQLIGHC